MDVKSLPDEKRIQLIYDAKNGSSYALGQLLQDNYSAVFKFVLKLTLNAQSAADVTQDCMVRVIDKFSLYDPEKSSLSTWMITIAKNLWIEECRKKARLFKIFDKYHENEEAYENSNIDEFLIHDEVLSALNRLSDKERMSLILKHLNGYSYEEIAVILKIPLGTVKSRISSGMKSFKKELESNER